MKDSAKRTKSQALAIYHLWHKTGLNQEAIEAHFNINDKGIYNTFGDQTELIDIHLQSQQLYMCSANCFCGRNHDYGGEMISFCWKLQFQLKSINELENGNELENEIEINCYNYLIIILGCTLFQKDYDVLSLCACFKEILGPKMKGFPYFVFEANRLI
ncbi:hypothetical protein BpHYR1_015010 [Brachionus plicatilis]|uniref:Uncharacterized protein n=1 Tax=Brachionus plicatilis TaxID=10195 RepID=A0A3M7T4T8_BRAPC|nr:hypothetical protein BpHYR1_015010 [Brachionus plicatilis]